MTSFRCRDPRTCDPPPAYALCKTCRHVMPSNLDCKVAEYRCKNCDHRTDKRTKANARALAVANANRSSAPPLDESDADIMAAQLARFTAALQRRGR